jgi:hypothetical protein
MAVSAAALGRDLPLAVHHRAAAQHYTNGRPDPARKGHSRGGWRMSGLYGLQTLGFPITWKSAAEVTRSAGPPSWLSTLRSLADLGEFRLDQLQQTTVLGREQFQSLAERAKFLP